MAIKHGLTIEQQNAIDFLAMGKTDLETAEAVGVHRGTVAKWRLHDPHFQAALNARRQEVFGAVADKLRSLAPKAVDTLATAMEGGSVSAAVAVLKATALDKLSRPAGPIDGEQIIRAMVEARFKAKCAAKEDAYMRLVGVDNPLRDDADDEAAARQEVEAEIASRLRSGEP
jgi:ActR/RegA family two-component response regulator